MFSESPLPLGHRGCTWPCVYPGKYLLGQVVLLTQAMPVASSFLWKVSILQSPVATFLLVKAASSYSQTSLISSIQIESRLFCFFCVQLRCIFSFRTSAFIYFSFSWSIPCKWLHLCNFFLCSFVFSDVLSVLSLPHSSKALSVRLQVERKCCVAMHCHAQMVAVFIITVPERVGGTDVFEEGEILVRSDLMCSGECIILLSKLSLGFCFTLSLVVDSSLLVCLPRSSIFVVQVNFPSSLTKRWERWILLICFKNCSVVGNPCFGGHSRLCMQKCGLKCIVGPYCSSRQIVANRLVFPRLPRIFGHFKGNSLGGKYLFTWP